ncbi:MAG: NTP transferase domain-containing protein [Deltaproteobacteria bacterium]|nr:NTP transferase domain-containing protein [Deltaproteobacteria bacterium]
MKKGLKIASVIFAAGRGSRMKDFGGNKTLLPLIADRSPFEGSHPILIHILESLPSGPKAMVVNYRKEEVIESTKSLDLAYCEQPLLNGTGGALIAAKGFLEEQDFDRLIITLGDVPLVRPSTYRKLLEQLDICHLTVLGFRPADKKMYGVLEIENNRVRAITEWEYWNDYSKDRQDRLEICNSGIFTARKEELIQYLRVLELRPHTVRKERNGEIVELEEFFITDLVELMHDGGLEVGYAIAEDEFEVMGVDDLSALKKAQEIYKIRSQSRTAS